MSAERLVYGLGELPALLPKHRIVGRLSGSSGKRFVHVVECACGRRPTCWGDTPAIAAERALLAFYDHVLDRENEGDR